MFASFLVANSFSFLCGLSAGDLRLVNIWILFQCAISVDRLPYSIDGAGETGHSEYLGACVVMEKRGPDSPQHGENAVLGA
jgi:hypothetical protein